MEQAVNNKKTLPEPEIFTTEIENTIDDLFKPSKKIEIDPLTQEVKEIQEEGDSLKFELEEEGAISEGPLPELKDATRPESTKTGAPPSPEPLLELDIELELEGSEESPGKAVETPSLAERLNQLKEQVFTIEWEVTRPEVRETISIVSELLGTPEVAGFPEAGRLLELMKEVLSAFELRPERLSATAPSILKRTVEMLFDILIEGNAETGHEALERLREELREILGTETDGDEHVRKAEGPALPDMPEIPDKDEDEIKPGVGTPAAQQDILQTAPPSPETVHAEHKAAAQPSPIENNYLTQEGRQLLRSHLIELKRCINKIEPLEKLLSKTPGMEKLHAFQLGIRTTLENQLSRIDEFFFEPGELKLPEPAPSKKTEEYARDMNLAKCPWKRLVTIFIHDLEVGFPADQVAFMSQPPWLAKFALKKSSEIALGKFKPWPWSKLQGLFRNRLSGLDETVLSTMRFPVIRSLGGHEIDISGDFHIILLYDGEKGAALLSGEAPMDLDIPEDAKWSKVKEEGFEAEIVIGDHKVRVATINSLKV